MTGWNFVGGNEGEDDGAQIDHPDKTQGPTVFDGGVGAGAFYKIKGEFGKTPKQAE